MPHAFADQRHCTECRSAYHRGRWAAGHRSPSDLRTRRTDYLGRRYNLTIAEYEAMLAKQAGGCAICGVEPHNNLRLAVDHTAEGIRGLLCRDCNLAIGKLGDGKFLATAAAYVEAVQHG